MDDTTEQAVQEAFDVLQLLLGVALGAAGSLLIGIVIWLALRVMARKSTNFRLLLKRVKIPYFALFFAAGSWVGMNYMAQVMTTDAVTWIEPLQHTLLILTIVMVGWLVFSGAFTIEDIAEEHSGSGSRRLTTQAQMFRRIIQLIAVVLALVAVILTFPSARVAMGSILASAGVISLVAGIAAQDSLSNVFAGLQITFTDALRVGDVVIVGDQFGTVEEVTLTYVVLRIWDERRVIVPSTQFTKNQFENWTRLHTKLSGTIELRLDWRAPVNLIRAEVDRLLSQTDLWDHRAVSVQVTDSNEDWMLVRVVVSAKTSGDLWDLRCYMRENLIEYLVQNAPYALPRTRYQQEELVEVEHDRSEEEIVQLAEELKELEGAPDGTPTDSAQEEADETEQEPSKSKEEARLRAAKRRAGKVRRKRLLDRIPHKDSLRDPESTRVLTPTEVLAIEESGHPAAPSKTDTKTDSTVSDRLFSGSEEAEARSKLLEGPGEEAQRERGTARTLRALRDGEISAEEAIERLGGGQDAREKVNTEVERIRSKDKKK